MAQTESVCLQCGRPGFDPWVGKFPGEGNGNPLQYSCLENPIDGGAWCPWGHKELDTTEQLHFHPIHWKDWCWSWNSNTLATWCEELTYWKRLWYWERLKAGGEGDDRGWDSWLASPTWWTWVWVSSGSLWWTGNFGVLQSMGLHKSDMTDWLNWTTELENPISIRKLKYVC